MRVGVLLLTDRATWQHTRWCLCMQDPFSAKQIYIMGISVLTVGLWCFNSKLQVYTGEMGVIAILPLVAFFGFGILNKVSQPTQPQRRRSCQTQHAQSTLQLCTAGKLAVVVAICRELKLLPSCVSAMPRLCSMPH